MYRVTQQSEILTVDEMTNKIRTTVCSLPIFQNLSVRGELLGFKRHTSGHVYFTLIGENSRISCVLWRSQAASILAWPKDGDEALVRGKLDVYGAYGSYQLYATALMPLGAGAKARSKAMLHRKLEAEGVFDIRNKKTFPRYPRKVAIITSPTSAALQDVLRISSHRWPSAELIIIPSLMQGVSAADEIISAFAKVAKLQDISAAMLVRGGGSRDDLDVFDLEDVVRAAKACPVPLVTGLGHQIDSTLCDLAADAEAPTPSGAAEFLFPDTIEVYGNLKTLNEFIINSIDRKLDKAEDFLDDVKKRFAFSLLRGYCEPACDRLNAQRSLLSEKMTQKIISFENKLAQYAAECHAASPLSILSKGYTACLDDNGKKITSAKNLAKCDEIEICFIDGTAKATIANVNVKN